MGIWKYVTGLLFGALGFAAAVFVYLALSCLIRIKEKQWCRWCLLLSCWQAVFMIIYIGDMLNLTISMVIFLAVLWIACEGTGLKKVTIGLMLGSTVFAFSGLWDNCAAYAAHYYGQDDLYEKLYPAGRLVSAVGLYLLIRMQKTEKDFELSEPLWKLMLMLTVSPLGIMISVILFSSPFVKISSVVLSDGVLFLVAMLSFIGLLRALTVLERQQRLERENTLANQNRRYYEAMEEQQFEVRRLRHDLSNHLQALLALPGQEKDAYIKGMLDNPALGQTLTWCGDSTINAVLTAKESLMRQKGIRFCPKIAINRELPFEKADICAIFANALDNAAEGCMELEDPLREIYLDARAGKGVLAVSVKNACKRVDTDDLPKKSAGKERLPETTKKDAKNHGLGLKSIQETVKKYGGGMEIDRKEESFHLFLYLPIPAEDRQDSF
ncbi:MAG: GHKL domain-containing protein [Lachnospiraceae bacterium]|nr:GHKL domain-containing protein [Lachnospiraceae bacterium]